MLMEIDGYRCPSCGWSDIIRANWCPNCGAIPVEARFPGQGRIATFTVIRYPPKGFEKDAPYIVALIDLENGPRVIGRVTTGLGDLQIGSPVRAVGGDGVLEFRTTK